MAITAKEAIESLEARADFLAKKIAEGDDAHPRHWERKELGAIRKAIELLERELEERLAE